MSKCLRRPMKVELKLGRDNFRCANRSIVTVGQVK